MVNTTEKAEMWMELALKEAEIAGQEGEIPVGALIVKNDKIIGKGFNQREKFRNVFDHAEIRAIKEACAYLNDWRLNGCDMYVTLEPCPMCAGTILQAKISRVFFGAANLQEGCGGSVINLLDYPGMSWQTECWGGICEEKCRRLLQSFLNNLR